MIHQFIRESIHEKKDASARMAVGIKTKSPSEETLRNQNKDLLFPRALGFLLKQGHKEPSSVLLVRQDPNKKMIILLV